jgi:sugar phosphate isomerase/epimerase
MCGPDVAYGPLALLSGTFEEKAAKAARLGYDGIELMVRDPAGLDWPSVKSTLEDAGLEVPQVVTGELFGADGLCLATADDDLYQRAEARLRSVIDSAAYLNAMVNIGRARPPEWLGQVNNAWDVAVDRLRGGPPMPRRKRAHHAGTDQSLRDRFHHERRRWNAAGTDLDKTISRPDARRFAGEHRRRVDRRRLRLAGDRLWHVHIADSHLVIIRAGHL